jgi:hypothetical protein
LRKGRCDICGEAVTLADKRVRSNIVVGGYCHRPCIEEKTRTDRGKKVLEDHAKAVDDEWNHDAKRLQRIMAEKEAKDSVGGDVGEKEAEGDDSAGNCTCSVM